MIGVSSHQSALTFLGAIILLGCSNAAALRSHLHSCH